MTTFLSDDPQGVVEGLVNQTDSHVVAPNPSATPLLVTDDGVSMVVHGPTVTDFAQGWVDSAHPLATIEAPGALLGGLDEYVVDRRHIHYSPDPCEWTVASIVYDQFGMPSYTFYVVDNSGVGELAQDWDEENPTPPIALPVTELVLPTALNDLQSNHRFVLQPLGKGYYAIVASCYEDGGGALEGEVRVHVGHMEAGEFAVDFVVGDIPRGVVPVLNERSAVLYFWSTDINPWATQAERGLFYKVDLSTEEQDLNGPDPSATQLVDTGFVPGAEPDTWIRRAFRAGDELICLETFYDPGFEDPPADVNDPLPERDGSLRIRRLGTVPHATLKAVSSPLFASAALAIEGGTNHHTGGASYVVDGLALAYARIRYDNHLEEETESYYREVVVDTGGGVAFLYYPALVVTGDPPTYESWGLDAALATTGEAPGPYGTQVMEVYDFEFSQYVETAVRLPYSFYTPTYGDAPEESLDDHPGSTWIVGKWLVLFRIPDPDWQTGPARYVESPFASTCGQFLSPPYVVGAGHIRSPEFMFSGLDPNLQSMQGRRTTVFLG